jgi:hypothetical protein
VASSLTSQSDRSQAASPAGQEKFRTKRGEVNISAQLRIYQSAASPSFAVFFSGGGLKAGDWLVATNVLPAGASRQG